MIKNNFKEEIEKMGIINSLYEIEVFEHILNFIKNYDKCKKLDLQIKYNDELLLHEYFIIAHVSESFSEYIFAWEQLIDSMYLEFPNNNNIFVDFVTYYD